MMGASKACRPWGGQAAPGESVRMAVAGESGPALWRSARGRRCQCVRQLGSRVPGQIYGTKRTGALGDGACIAVWRAGVGRRSCRCFNG